MRMCGAVLQSNAELNSLSHRILVREGRICADAATKGLYSSMETHLRSAETDGYWNVNKYQIVGTAKGFCMNSYRENILATCLCGEYRPSIFVLYRAPASG